MTDNHCWKIYDGLTIGRPGVYGALWLIPDGEVIASDSAILKEFGRGNDYEL